MLWWVQPHSHLIVQHLRAEKKIWPWVFQQRTCFESPQLCLFYFVFSLLFFASWALQVCWLMMVLWTCALFVARCPHHGSHCGRPVTAHLLLLTIVPGRSKTSSSPVSTQGATSRPAVQVFDVCALVCVGVPHNKVLDTLSNSLVVECGWTCWMWDEDWLCEKGFGSAGQAEVQIWCCVENARIRVKCEVQEPQHLKKHWLVVCVACGLNDSPVGPWRG